MSSKVATYLQEHISGEVVTNPAVLDAMSRDASILEITPEMVVYPRVTSDIRKVARFAWQLAEKGHVLPIVARGSGTDQTGAAIGKGIVLATTAHMNNILEFDLKQKLVRLQPGVNMKALNDALGMHGLGLPAMPRSAAYSTVGGAVANNASGPLSGKYGDMSKWVQQLEVVLANGDLLQTTRLSKRELNKKKGLQTFEGELYRSLDNLIDDNKQLIDERLGGDPRDNAGYNSLAYVKQKDGSFDLTPLFLGSQGTLGIVSEMILRSDFISNNMSVTVAVFTSYEAARDLADAAVKMEPALVEYYDSEYFTQAASHGKQYPFYKDLDTLSSAVLVVGFDDFSEHARKKKQKRFVKLLESVETTYVSAEGEEAADLLSAREVTAYWDMQHPGAVLPLFEGAFIPPERFEDFSKALVALSEKHHVHLPLFGSPLESIYSTRPVLNLKKVGDKQKIFKLLDEYSKLVDQHNGYLIAVAGDGRLKSRFTSAQRDDEVAELFASVKAIFDPNGTLNPGVKQPHEVRQLVSWLRSDYGQEIPGSYVPY